jgi:hypothetical protein
LVVLLVLLALTLVYTGCSSNNASEVVPNSGNPTLEQLLADARLEKAEISTWHESVVPDSVKPQMAEWITKTIEAASSHMTGGDYEDPEDLVEEVYERAVQLFTVDKKISGLTFIRNDQKYWDRERIEDLTPALRRVYDCLNR